MSTIKKPGTVENTAATMRVVKSSAVPTIVWENHFCLGSIFVIRGINSVLFFVSRTQVDAVNKDKNKPATADESITPEHP